MLTTIATRLTDAVSDAGTGAGTPLAAVIVLLGACTFALLLARFVHRRMGWRCDAEYVEAAWSPADPTVVPCPGG